jgi:Ni,Fe-hydrogenase maturation factor
MKKKINIYIFGNPLLSFDSLPIKLIPDLEKKFPQIKFIQKDPNENLKPNNKKLVIIDTVSKIKEVKVFNKIEELETEKIYSAHDFDLAFNLKLLQKIGKLNNVIIFGIPSEIKKQEALNQLSCLIEFYLELKSN